MMKGKVKEVLKMGGLGRIPVPNLNLEDMTISILDVTFIDPRYEWSIIFGSWISNFAKPAFNWFKKIAKPAFNWVEKNCAR
jgi:hypothetical protein